MLDISFFCSRWKRCVAISLCLLLSPFVDLVDLVAELCWRIMRLHHVSCCVLNWIICHLLFPMTKMNGCRREFCVQWFGSRLVFKRHIVPLRSHYPPVSLSSPKQYVNASHFHWDIHQNAVTCFWVGFGFAATKHQPYEDHMVCSPICLTYTYISSAVLYCVAHYYRWNHFW